MSFARTVQRQIKNATKGLLYKTDTVTGQIVIQDHLSAPRDRVFPNTQGMEPGEKNQAARHTTSTPLYSLELDSWDRSVSKVPLM